MLRAWGRPSSTTGFLVFSVVCGCSFPSGRRTWGLVSTQEVGCPGAALSAGFLGALSQHAEKQELWGQVAGCVCHSLRLCQRLNFSGLRAMTKGDGMAHP